MRRCLVPLAAISACALAAPPEPKFHAVTIDPGIQIGYGVAVADVDGDGKPDILLADKKQFVWYRNPGAEKAAEPGAWTKYIIAENLTEHDNVCLAAQDLDGDGKCELAVGADWNPSDTVHSGAVFYLIPPPDCTQRWEPVKFPSVEPTTHRMKWMKLDEKEWGLVVIPLHGRGNNAKTGEGASVNVLCYHKPADVRGEWKMESLAAGSKPDFDPPLHLTHNFQPADWNEYKGMYVASKEGVAYLIRTGDPLLPASHQHARELGWTTSWVSRVGSTTKTGPGSIGAGEVRNGLLPNTRDVIAAIEPMHGNVLAIYFWDGDKTRLEWDRHVLTDQLTEGHALACGDLLGTGSDQIVVGWRGNPQKPKPVGIKLFTVLDENGEQWRDSIIDDNEMACEDLVLGDLNADGKLDVVASGRSTHNLKIYLNETP